MRKHAVVLLLLSQLIVHSQNCNYTISGKVIDLHDGSLLSGATLVVSETELATQTTLDGVYTLSNLCNNTTYKIKVLHSSCQTKIFSVKVTGHMKRDFRLEHHLEELNEIILEGKAYENTTKTVLENNVSKETLERFSTGSMGDALSSLSGVTSLNKGNGIVKPIINGLHSSRLVIINNDVRMQDQEWGVEHAPNIDINSIGRLTLVKSAGALQFGGDAVGGVIIVEGQKVPVKDSLYGKTLVSAASNGRGAIMSSHLTKSFENGYYATVHGSLKRFGDFEAAHYNLTNTGLAERNASLRLGLNRFNHGLEAYYSFFNNEIGILRASHLHGAADQVRALSSNTPLIVNDFDYQIGAPKQQVTHHLARIKGFKKFENFGKLSLQYDYQQNNRLEFDIRRGDDKDKAALDLKLDTHTVLLDFDSNSNNAIHLKSGLMARYQNNFANPETGVRRLIPDYKKYDLGLYLIGDYKVNDQWQIEAGARFDYVHMDVYKFYRTSFWENRNYDELYPNIVIEDLGTQVLTNPNLKFNNGSATLGAKYSFNEDYHLFFNYALASRAPNPSELFSEGLHHSGARIELGDLSFKSEIGHKISATLQRDHESFSFSLNPYINTISNYVIIEPTSVRETIRGNFQVWEYRQTQAQLIGIDVDAAYKYNENISSTHQLSIVKGYDRKKDLPLISMPPISTRNEIKFTYPRFHNLKMELQSQYVFAQNEYPNNNFEVYIPETESTETVDISTPPSAYHLLNFNSSIEFKIAKKSLLTVGLGITNITNTSYRNYLNLQRFYADDLGRNFLLNLKLNY
ncbi:MAG: TonB-dependent receptor [Flavobacteriaceae bacterium]|nr:TonB-dependent receptor [Flavobacteriaceae bacterium]